MTRTSHRSWPNGYTMLDYNSRRDHGLVRFYTAMARTYLAVSVPPRLPVA